MTSSYSVITIATATSTIAQQQFQKKSDSRILGPPHTWHRLSKRISIPSFNSHHNLRINNNSATTWRQQKSKVPEDDQLLWCYHNCNTHINNSSVTIPKEERQQNSCPPHTWRRLSKRIMSVLFQPSSKQLWFLHHLSSPELSDYSPFFVLSSVVSATRLDSKVAWLYEKWLEQQSGSSSFFRFPFNFLEFSN